MKIVYLVPLLIAVAGASCQTKVNLPNYPANTLVECPELELLVIDAESKGVSLKNYYLDSSRADKQYADCATIHNELVRFIKKQQIQKDK